MDMAAPAAMQSDTEMVSSHGNELWGPAHNYLIVYWIQRIEKNRSESFSLYNLVSWIQQRHGVNIRFACIFLTV